MQPETRFKTRIRPLLNALPCSWWVKTQFMALSGIPDFLGCVAGRFVALELKTTGKKATKLQGWVLAKIRDAGGYAEVVTPENWEKVYSELRALAS